MKKIIILLLFSILLINIASASVYLNIYIDETGKATFLGETNENPTFPEGISINNEKIIGSTSNLTSKQGDIWRFSYSLKGSELNVILPEDAIIENVSSGNIYLDNDRLSIYTKDSIKVSYKIQQAENNSFYYIYIILLIVLFIIIAFFYYKTRKKEVKKVIKETKKDKLDIIKNILNEREKLIIEKLKETGKTKSSYLRKMCNLPKASFSRHIQQLERKKLIKRSGEGRNKFIQLSS